MSRARAAAKSAAALTPPGLPFVRACELVEPEPGRRWLIEQLWTRSGVGIIGGAPKSCKSWLGLDLALSVASGTPCLGSFAASEPGPTLVYLAEDPPGIVKERLSSLCAARGLELDRLPLFVITSPTLRLDLEADQRRLTQTLGALRPRLLLLDPFVRLHRIDENSAAEVSSLLGFLRSLEREHGLSVVVVHHTRKNGTGSGSAGQGLRGSGDFHAWTDSALYVRKKGDRILLTVEHRAAPAPEPLALRLVTDPGAPPHLALADGVEIVPSAGSDLDVAVLDALALARGPATRSALRELVGVRNERLGAALDKLSARGTIVRTPAGWIPADRSVPPSSPTNGTERSSSAAPPHRPSV